MIFKNIFFDFLRCQISPQQRLSIALAHLNINYNFKLIVWGLGDVVFILNAILLESDKFVISKFAFGSLPSSSFSKLKPC